MMFFSSHSSFSYLFRHVNNTNDVFLFDFCKMAKIAVLYKIFIADTEGGVEYQA